MKSETAETQDPWVLLHDLVFGVPHPALVAVESLAAILLIVAIGVVVARIWMGDNVELGPLKIERSELVGNLTTSLDALSRDDRLKANVLWMFRDRLNEANGIVYNGIEEASVHQWCSGVLTDIITALSEGGHDRHRASLWIRTGNELRMYDGMGFRQAAVDHARLPLTSIAGNVLRTGVHYTASDVDDDRTFCPKPRSGQPYKSLLAVPVKSPLGKPIAALCVDAEAHGYFDRDHEFFATCFADLISLLVGQVILGEGS